MYKHSILFIIIPIRILEYSRLLVSSPSRIAKSLS